MTSNQHSDCYQSENLGALVAKLEQEQEPFNNEELWEELYASHIEEDSWIEEDWDSLEGYDVYSDFVDQAEKSLIEEKEALRHLLETADESSLSSYGPTRAAHKIRKDSYNPGYFGKIAEKELGRMRRGRSWKRSSRNCAKQWECRVTRVHRRHNPIAPH